MNQNTVNLPGQQAQEIADLLFEIGTNPVVRTEIGALKCANAILLGHALRGRPLSPVGATAAMLSVVRDGEPSARRDEQWAQVEAVSIGC